MAAVQTEGAPIAVGRSLKIALSDHAFQPSSSFNGRFVALQSRLGIAPGDDNGLDDIYLLDRSARRYIWVSQANGQAGNGASVRPQISSDGSAIVFHSAASNLVTGDLNGAIDVFMYTRASGTIELISASPTGDAANEASFNASISGDGRFIAFASSASDLVADDSNDASDIFLVDRFRSTLQRVSVASDGSQGDAGSFLPSLSTNGRYIAFESDATNFSDNEFDQLVDLFVHDTVRARTLLVNVSSRGVRANGLSKRPAISADGRYIAFYSQATTFFPEREDFQFDIFVHDLLSRRTELISRPIDDEMVDASSFNPSLSFDGNLIAYQSNASNLSQADDNNLSDIFLFNRSLGQTHHLSRQVGASGGANAGSFTPFISGDGSTVLFETLATNLDDILASRLALFAHDVATGGLDRLTRIDQALIELDGHLDRPQFATSGRYLSFSSTENNIVLGDQNGYEDVFLFDRLTSAIRLVSADATGQPVAIDQAQASTAASASADGCRVVFQSDTNGDILLADAAISDANDSSDIYLRDYCAEPALRTLTLRATADRYADGPSSQPQISADGRWIAFTSRATDLLVPQIQSIRSQVYLFDLDSNSLTLVSRNAQNQPTAFDNDSPSPSSDGRFVTWVGRDPELATLPQGQKPAPGNTAIYRYDHADGQVDLISRGLDSQGQLTAPLGHSDQPSISSDGALIAFRSTATNLVRAGATGIPQVYVWDQHKHPTNSITLMQPTSALANGASEQPNLSADGRVVVFQSEATNWAVDDNNGNSDIIAVDLSNLSTTLVSRTDQGQAAIGGPSIQATVAASGQHYQVAYISSAGITGNPRNAGLYLQPLQLDRFEISVQGFVDSPLQTVGRGMLRVQLRNDGNQVISTAHQLRLNFPRLEHDLRLQPNPRWLCDNIGALTCDFIGDAVLGQSILPGAAENIEFEFDMFAGAEAIVSQVDAGASFTITPPTATLTTERVQRGLTWQAAVPTELARGASGQAAINLINGGMQTVADIQVGLAPLNLGTAVHPIAAGQYGDWSCQPDPDPQSNFLLLCSYSGSALAAGDSLNLSLPFIMDNRPLRRSLLLLSAPVDAIAPREALLIETTTPGLIFFDGLED